MATIHAPLSHSPTPLSNSGIIFRPDKNLQDKKDLEKFSKFFTLKVAQVIVQSRLGEKIKYPSRASSTDWFNLAIDDNLEILQQTKLAIGPNNSLSSGTTCLIIEISLKTQDSKKLTLELWKLYFNDDETHQNNTLGRSGSTLYTAYNAMSLLLKSLITVTRVLPAYKLSRVNGKDYVMDYKIYTLDNQNAKTTANDYYSCKLGKECQKSVLGSVVTQFGSIFVEFAYRTQMEMNFVQSSMINDVMEDHYSLENSPNRNSNIPAQQATSLKNTRHKIPAFSDPLPFTSLNDLTSNNNLLEDKENKIPFANLLRRASLNESTRQSSSSMQAGSRTFYRPIPNRYTQSQSQYTSSSITESQEFEFLGMKPLPFAPEITNTSSDPASFFNALQNPPVLQSLETSSSSSPIEVDQQLHKFEEHLSVFDEFVQKLCLADVK